MGQAIVAALLMSTFLFIYTRKRRTRLSDIPTAGYAGSLTSYFSAFRYLKEANVVLQLGYDKYKNKLYKVPQMDQWLVLTSGNVLTENLRAAPENVLSMYAAMSDILQSDYTLGPQIRQDTYHLNVIRYALNKNLSDVLPTLLDEMACAFSDEIDTKLEERASWTPIPAVETFTRIVCRASNRIFVGLPVCRNKEYCDVNIQFAANVMIGGLIINLFPKSLKPYVGKVFSKISGHQRRILQQLGPIIEERKKKITEYGADYPGKPNDMLSWLMDAATPGLEQTAESLALRVLNINFMALHSTSMSFTHALYTLAANPRFIPDLRAEVETHLGKQYDAWKKDSLEECWKLDSFLKESQRMNSLGGLSMPRKALIPFVFSDGTTIPVGTMVAAAATPTHLDGDIYQNPHEFDPFRFSRLREQAAAKEGSHIANSNDEDARLRLTGTGLEYLAFGGGRHACPGRFFVSSEMKSLMAYVLLNYDIKMEDEGVRPKDLWFGPACVPNQSAKVLFRRRISSSM